VQEPATDTGDVEDSSEDPYADIRVDDPETPYDESLRPEDEGFDPVADALGRQRRQNVRVDVQLPITLRMHGREGPGRTRDVSASGIGFSTRLPVELDQLGEVTVEFDGWRFTKAFIVRFVKPILAGCQVGVQFDELTQEEREKLVKQVFDVQRAQLQGARRPR
jgi:c-di-GMP-binding flagellar brake protein YcgR